MLVLVVCVVVGVVVGVVVVAVVVVGVGFGVVVMYPFIIVVVVNVADDKTVGPLVVVPAQNTITSNMSFIIMMAFCYTTGAEIATNVAFIYAAKFYFQ